MNQLSNKQNNISKIVKFLFDNFNLDNSLKIGPWSLIILLFFLLPLSSSAATLGRSPNNLGLVSYWKFDEGVGTKAMDNNGKGNNGTITGATWTNGKFGKALSFNGSTNYVSAGTSDTLNMTGDFTSSLWFKTPGQGLNNWGSLIGRGTASYFINAPNKGWYLVARNISGTNYINFQYSGASTAQQVSWTGGADNLWHHAVVSRQGNLFSIYIDGVLKSSLTTAVGDMSTSGEGFFIGRGRSTDYFIGSIDEVRIYNRALSAVEIANLYKISSAKMLKGPTLVQIGTCLLAGNTCTINITNTAGNLLWVGINDYSVISNGYIYSVTDTKGNSYPTASPATDTGNVNAPQIIQTFYAVNIPAGANTITCSRGAHNGGSGRCVVMEYSGLATVSPFDGHQEASLTGTNYTSGSLSTSNANDLLIGYFASRLNQTWGGLSWTSRFQNNIDFGVLVQDKLVSSKGLYSVNATASNSAAGVVAINAFKSASGSTKLNSSQNKTGGTLDNGLIGMWSFNGADMNWTSQTAGTVVDSSGNGNTGTLTNMNLKTSPAIGKVNQGLMFDKVDDAVNAGSASMVDNLQALSYCAWIKPRTFGQQFIGMIFSKAFVKYFGITSSNKLDFFVSYDGTNIDKTTASNSVSYNVWSHVCATWSGAGSNSVAIYLNGSSMPITGSDGTGNTVTEAASSYVLGNVGSGGRTFDGIIDEARLYNRALTANEVKQLYLMGK